MVKGKWLLVGLLVIIAGLVCSCAESTYITPLPATNTPTPPATATPAITDTMPKVKLAQSVIDVAVKECQEKTNWGINLAIVRINYVAGTHVEAAIVLHNGDDVERLVKLKYSPSYSPVYEKDSGITYEPTPIEAYGWVSVDTKKIRLETMGTEVVPIHLLVPSDYGELPDNWTFNITAHGIGICQYQYTIIVTTEVDDTTLLLKLPHPLLDGSLESIDSIVSAIDEPLYASDYDPFSQTLTIEGLKEQEVREVTLIYEHGEQVMIDYDQRWLITMLR